MKRRQLVEEDLWESPERVFRAYGEPLEIVTSFKYLVRVMTVGDNNWPSVTVNLRKYWNSCSWMTRILVQKGAEPRVSDSFFKAVVKALLIFRVGDVGPDPLYGAGSGQIPAQGRATDHREAVAEAGGGSYLS